MTGRPGEADRKLAMHDLPETARRFATAMAAEIEGDCCALGDFAQWVGLAPTRVHALVVLADTLAGVAGWTPDAMRTYATTNERTRARRPR